jgi:hypothetical protein
MSAYTELSAADIAGCLRMARRCPHATGSLSQLDEATLAYGSLFPEIDPVQRAFADARHAHMRSYRTAVGNYSDEAWDRAVVAAEALADALEPLGGYRIARCKRPDPWGICNLPLRDGECRSADHTDSDPVPGEPTLHEVQFLATEPAPAEEN